MDHKELKYEVEQQLNLEIRSWLQSEFNRLAQPIPRVENMSWRQYVNPSNGRFYVELKQDFMKFNDKTLDEWYHIDLRKGDDPYNRLTNFHDFVRFSENIIPVFAEIDSTILKDLFGFNCWITVDKNGFRSQGYFV